MFDILLQQYFLQVSEININEPQTSYISDVLFQHEAVNTAYGVQLARAEMMEA